MGVEYKISNKPYTEQFLYSYFSVRNNNKYSAMCHYCYKNFVCLTHLIFPIMYEISYYYLHITDEETMAWNA